MSQMPELIHTSNKGGSIYRYDIPGGKSTFTRFLSCYLGSCKFCNDFEEAETHLKATEVLFSPGFPT